jgi:hypothetical protein
VNRTDLIKHVAEAQFDAVRRVPDNLQWETCPQPVRDAYITGTTAAFAALEAAGFAVVVAESIPSSLVNYIDRV